MFLLVEYIKVDFLLLASGEGNRFSKHKLKQFARIGNLSILESR